MTTTRVERSTRRRPGSDAGDRWEELIAAAVDLFYEKGYTATTLQDLGDAVGLLKGSVYHYIETKEDLLYEIMRRALELRASTIVEDPALAGSDAEQRLSAFIRRWMAASKHASKLGVVGETEFQRLSSRKLRAVIAQRDKYAEFVTGIIEAGIREGLFDPWTDPTFATNAVFAIMRNLPVWFHASGPQSFEEVVEWHVEFVLRAVRARSI